VRLSSTRCDLVGTVLLHEVETSDDDAVLAVTLAPRR
jgi:hypothetical protein